MLCNQSLPKLFSITLPVLREADSYLYQGMRSPFPPGHWNHHQHGFDFLHNQTAGGWGDAGGGTRGSHPQLHRSTDLTSKTISRTSETMDFLATQKSREAAKQVSCQMLRSCICPRATQWYQLLNMPSHTTITVTHSKSRPPFLLTNNKRRLPGAI